MEENNIICFRGKEKSETTISALQTEMAQYLQMDNLSFLIGAGCSSNIIDGKETGIPGMAALYDGFFELYPEFSVAEKQLKSMFDRNLERMLEAMIAIKVANGISVVDAKIDEKISFVQQYMRGKIIEGLSGCDVKEIYKCFYTKITQRTRKAPISIFTTNYDLFNESALDDLGFPYNNGFSGTYRRKFNPTCYNYMYVENMNLHRDVCQ